MFTFFLRLIILFVFSASLFGQSASPYIIPSNRDFVITNWQTEQGLPQNSVTSIVQTVDGHIWFGTQQGMANFDGTSFEVFSQQKTGIFQFTNIFAMAAANDGGIWLGATGGGVFHFNRKKYTRLTVPNDSLHLRPARIFTGTNNDLFIEDGFGLHLIRNGKSVFLTSPGGAVLKSLTYQFEESPGSYILTGKPGTTYRLENETLSEIVFPNAPGGYNNFIRKADDKTYILTNQSGAFLFKDNRITSVLFNDQPIKGINNLTIDKNGGLWFLSNNDGVYYYDGRTTVHFNRENGLSHNLVFSVFCDAENNIWVGTLPAGVNKISRNFVRSLSVADKMPNEFLFSMAKNSKGDICFGSYGGGAFIKTSALPDRFERINNIPGNVIRTVFYDRNDVLWVGSYLNGLFRINGKEVTQFTVKDGLPDNSVYSIYQDKTGTIWFGTEHGLVSFNGKSFNKYYLQKQGAEDFIRCIKEDREGNIWFGTDGNGLRIIKSGKIVNPSADVDFLRNSFVRSMHCDSDGTMWICSGSGLARYKNGKFFWYSAVESLLDETFYDLLEDNNGRLWTSSNHGIYVLNKSDMNDFADGKIQYLNVTIIDKSDGMLSSECNGGNQPSGMTGSDNRIYFPTLKGAVIIDPEEFGNLNKPISLHIQKVLFDDKEVEFTGDITIPAGVNRVEIFYSALSFTSSQKISFRHKLIGFDDKFVAAGPLRSAVYSRLQPGDYEFILVTGSGFGSNVTAPLRLKVKMQPYFYQTAWFTVLWVLFLIGAVPGAYFVKIKRYKQRQAELTRIVEERTQSLREEKEKTEAALLESNRTKTELAQVNIELARSNKLKTDLLDIAAHDLKNPLNAIKGFSQVIIEENNWHSETPGMLRIIQSASASMLTLIEDILKSSRLEQAEIKLKLVQFSVCELIDATVKHNEYNLKKKEQSLLVNCDSSLNIISDKDKLSEVLDNLLSNAIKYSHRGKMIQLSASVKDSRTVLFAVKDEGLGMTVSDIQQAFGKFTKLSARPTENEGSTGLGLSIVKGLVEAMGGNVWIESEPGKGSTFYFTLPSGMQNVNSVDFAVGLLSGSASIN